MTELLKQEPARNDVRLELASAQLSRRDGSAALQTLKPMTKVDKEMAPRFFEILAFADLDSGNRDEALKAARRWRDFAVDRESKTRAQRFVEFLEQSGQAGRTTATMMRVETEEPSAPTLRRQETEPPPKTENAEKEERAEKAETVPPPPSVTGVFVQLDCRPPAAQFIVEVNGARKVFRIEDPQSITVVSESGGTLELECGPQKRIPVEVEYEPTDKPGADGVLRLIRVK